MEEDMGEVMVEVMAHMEEDMVEDTGADFFQKLSSLTAFDFY